MKYIDQTELRLRIEYLIRHNKFLKKDIAKELGLTQQGFSKLLNKKQFSMDDLNRILSVMGYELHYDFRVKSKEDK